MEIGCRIYKPRRPRESPLYRLVERHLDELLRVWLERFARRHGPLRRVVERVLPGFLRCGLDTYVRTPAGWRYVLGQAAQPLKTPEPTAGY